MGSRDRPGNEAKKKPKDKERAEAAAPHGRRPSRRSSSGRNRKPRHTRASPTRADRTDGRSRAPPPSIDDDRSVTGMATISERTLDERNGSERPVLDRATAERTKAVDAAILAIEKQFGRGSIMKLGSSDRQAVDFIPTGSIALDLALGVGGIPRGRISEIFGPESSGKTTRLPAHHRRGPAAGRRGRLHRRRARPRSGLRPGLRRQRRRAPGQPAGHRRAGPRDHRDADPLGRDRRRRRSTRSRPSCRGPRSRARWAIRSSASRPA